MTYPTFTNGQVLPASDLNAIGLWLVKSQTVGSGVSSVTVTGAFSADYDNYRVVYSGGVGSTTGDLRLTMNNATANWYGSLIYGVYNANTVFGIGTNNAANYPYCGSYDTSYVLAEFDVLTPFTASLSTVVNGPFHGNLSMGYFNARHAALVSNSAFTLTAATGTISGGTISVYGYRKA